MPVPIASPPARIRTIPEPRATMYLIMGEAVHSLGVAEANASSGDSSSPSTNLIMSRLADELIASVIQAAEFNRTVGRRFKFISMIGDATVVVGALFLASWLGFKMNVFGIGTSSSEADFRSHMLPIGIEGLPLLLLLAHYGMYYTAQLLRYRHVAFLIIKGCTIWFVGAFLAVKTLNPGLLLPARFLALAAVCLLFALLIWRKLLHLIAKLKPFAWRLRERILFVGWNDLSERLTKSVIRDPANAYEVVGCIPPSSGAYEKEPPAHIPHMAASRDIVSMLRTKCIDIVLLADRETPMTKIDELATACEKEMAQLKVIPSYFQVLSSGLSLQTIGGIPVLGISRLPLDLPVNQILKRAVDILGSIAGLILSAPIMALFGAWVYLESPGPVLYRQRRAGRGGTLFEIIKIRSMKLDAEAGGKPGWTVNDDPRRLKIGAFMRKWNIDELPQFWNVLKGEMSLVGPRPERPELIANFKEEIAHYNARHWTKPGVTGWAAVNGLRGDTDLSERIRCDLYYMENWSLWLDFQIMFLTFFRHKNAA